MKSTSEFIAMTVADTLGESADLFEIDTGDHYPPRLQKNLQGNTKRAAEKCKAKALEARSEHGTV